MHIDQVDTPAVLVDLDRVEANIARLQHYLDVHGIANRPHIKTHKIPALARAQLDAGAVGIACQKVSEAEVMVDAGIDDVFIPYNIVGQTKLDRLMRLAARAKVSVTADSAATIRGMPRSGGCGHGASRGGGIRQRFSALWRPDARGGSFPGTSDRGILRAAVRWPDDLSHTAQSDDFVRATRALLQPHGLPVACVSYGARPRCGPPTNGRR